MPSEGYDIVVIGGGPGGYVAAIRGAQLKARVALIEKDKLGGTCTNVGCIPAKTMLYAAELVHEVRKAEEFGIKVQGISIDYGTLIAKKNEVVSRLSNGIRLLLESNGVEVISGEARLASPNVVEVGEKDLEGKTVKGERIIIATGSRPALPPIDGAKSKGVFTSDEAFDLPDLPKSIVIVGGGPEGAEFASIYSSLGVETTLVEMLPRIIPNEDQEVASRLHQSLSKDGVKVHTNARVNSIAEANGGMRVRVEGVGELGTEGVLIAVGRSPNTSGLGLEELGMRLEKGRVVVNERMETSVSGVYAIGDVTGGAFAHEAMEEGIVAAENAMGLHSVMDHFAIPRCVYTVPEVAAVGLTEEQAKGRGHRVRVGRFTYSANGRAYTMGEKEGLVKVVVDESTENLLGIHIIGARASELVSEAAVAMSGGDGGKVLRRTIHPHPTLSEAIREAALDLNRIAIHRVRVSASRQ